MEGKCEVMAVNKEDPDTKLNLTELLRNLYIKIYKLEDQIRKVTPPPTTSEATQTE